MADLELSRMKSALEGQDIFLNVDEGEVQGVHFLAILMGALHEPATTYLFKCKPLSSTPTGLIVGQAVDTATYRSGGFITTTSKT